MSSVKDSVLPIKTSWRFPG